MLLRRKKRATAKNKGADQPARTRRLICAFVVCTYIKAGFLSDSHHRSSTSCTTFVWTALQWRTYIQYWNIGSTFVRGWIRNWLAVKVTFSKTVRGNEEWQIESVINQICQTYVNLFILFTWPLWTGSKLFATQLVSFRQLWLRIVIELCFMVVSWFE